MNKVSASAAVVLVIVALIVVAFSFKRSFVNSDRPATGPPGAAAMAEFKKH